MYKALNLRKEVNSIDYNEEVLQIRQLFDSRFAIVSGTLTDNKIRIYDNKNIDPKNTNSFFTINELNSPIVSINQCTNQTLLVLTLDTNIYIIELLQDSKYSIIQTISAVQSNINNNNNNESNNSNDKNEKEDEKILYYKQKNSRISTMVDYNSCVIMQLSNSLIFSIYDKTIKFYQVSIINNLYEQVKKIDLYDIFNEPLEIDSSTLILLSWSSQTIHVYNIDTQLLLKRIDQVNAYITVRISEEYFGAIGPKYVYLISVKEQEIRNLFNLPGGYEIRSAVLSPNNSIICVSQTISSCDIVEFEIDVEEFKEIGKIVNPHKNDDYENEIKIGSSIINNIIITYDNELISSGGDKKVKFWN